MALGQEVGEAEIVTLFSARGPEVRQVAEVADDLRRRIAGDDVTFVRNRNINYTNVCTFKCRFCAFSKGPLSLNLRGAPYLLELDEITRRVAEAVDEGATEVCLQGGIHPNFDGDYYLHVLEAVRAGSPDIHIHGFTALEVTEGARRSEVPLAEYLTRLKEAGLKTLPGTAAEILDDEVRALICPDKINTEEWLEAHRTAHSVGLRSNITIMFGSVEQPVSWARHMVRTRALQRETGGFTEFVPLPFVHMATPIYLQKKARRGPTFRETVLMHSVARIAYVGDIDNIQVSWVKMGAQGARAAAAGRGQRPRGHAHGREHLAGGGRAARPTHGRRGAGGHCGAARAATGAALHLVRVGRRAGRRVTDEAEASARQRAFDILTESNDLSAAQARELQDMIGSLGDLAREGTSVGDLKIANVALAEMAEAFRVFRPYRHIRKITMFGSARTKPDDPIYILARDLAAKLAAADWMVVTGAGPGIMAAGLEGAGREHAFGVNIRLPFEGDANPFIAQDPKLVEMRYFFTRKLMLIKESHAYAVLPGGFGTQDESFELLTLLQTGKAEPAPVVMVETPGGTYWHSWLRFVRESAIDAGWVSPEDQALFKVTNTLEEACEEVLGFYRNYHSIRWVGDLLVLRMQVQPSKAELADLNRRFADIVVRGNIRTAGPFPPERNDHPELPRLAFRFDRFHYSRLRQLINAVNECTG